MESNLEQDFIDQRQTAQPSSFQPSLILSFQTLLSCYPPLALSILPSSPSPVSHLIYLLSGHPPLILSAAHISHLSTFFLLYKSSFSSFTIIPSIHLKSMCRPLYTFIHSSVKLFSETAASVPVWWWEYWDIINSRTNIHLKFLLRDSSDPDAEVLCSEYMAGT